MDRFCLGVALLGVVVCLSGLAHAQGFAPFQGSDTLNVGGVELNSSVRIGYQSMNLSMNLPLPQVDNVYLGLMETGALDLKLVDGGVWTGGMHVGARKGPFLAFAGADINASKKARAATTQEPFRLPVLKPNEWTVSGLAWWNVDVGLGYYLRSNVGVVAGLTLERLSFRMTEPHDPHAALFLQLLEMMGADYAGEFSTRMSVPYAGIRLDGGYFKGLIRFSPVAFANVSVPLTFAMDLSEPPAVASFAEKAEYKFKRNCLWIDGYFESAVEISSDLHCAVWLKGNWYHLRGKGYEDHSYKNADDQGWTYVLGPQGSMSGSAEGTYTFSAIAIGLRGELSFSLSSL
jgi:hypothetical protein